MIHNKLVCFNFRFKGPTQDHLLKADIALHSTGIIDEAEALFAAGPLNKELLKYIDDKPGNDK